MNNDVLENLRGGCKVVDIYDSERNLHAQKFDQVSTDLDYVTVNNLRVGDDEVYMVEIFEQSPDKPLMESFVVSDDVFMGSFMLPEVHK